MKKIFHLLFVFFMLQNGMAQSSAIPLGNDAYNIIDRLEISTGKSFEMGTSLKPYLRNEVVRYAIDLDTSRLFISAKDRKDLFWLFKDNNEWLTQSETATTLLGKQEKERYTDENGVQWTTSQMKASYENNRYTERTPILKYFFKTPANFFQMDNKNFHLRLNPILNVKYFEDFNDDKIQFQNTRGIELRGGIDDRVYFYTNILENQVNFAPYLRERILRDTTVPMANLYKPYFSSVSSKLGGYDYTLANGYVGFNVTKHIGVQFGHGQSFIGDGMRSMILSDYSPNYLYLKFNTRFGKFQYQNLFAEMQTTYIGGDVFAPKKHLATHFFNYNITKNLSVGLFESIVYGGRPGRGWDINYFNPIIFYRSIEYLGNSEDNALVGAQAKWNFLHRFSLYSQFLLDEFNFSLFFPKDEQYKGWWAKKYAFQTGLKYINIAGIDHLDGQIEYNVVRPYTYSHDTYFTNYVNRNQPLAHPLGANFKELIAKIRYQPSQKVVFDARFIKTMTGEDSLNIKYSMGQNPVRSYRLLPREYGHTIGNGVRADITMLALDFSYQFMHNWYADVHYFYRRKNSADITRNQTTHYIGAGLRINIGNRRNEY
jgi:hypothetical protein